VIIGLRGANARGELLRAGRPPRPRSPPCGRRGRSGPIPASAPGPFGACPPAALCTDCYLRGWLRHLSAVVWGRAAHPRRPRSGPLAPIQFLTPVQGTRRCDGRAAESYLAEPRGVARGGFPGHRWGLLGGAHLGLRTRASRRPRHGSVPAGPPHAGGPTLRGRGRPGVGVNGFELRGRFEAVHVRLSCVVEYLQRFAPWVDGPLRRTGRLSTALE
jgi:hypothetical protein